MPVVRLSACRPGALGNQVSTFRIFGEAEPGQLEHDARDAVPLDDIYRQSGAKPLAEQPMFDADAKLAQHLNDMPDSALGDPMKPVVVFVHGFQFDVRMPRPDPFSRIKTNNPHIQVFHFEEASSPESEHAHHHTPWLARTFLDTGCGAEADCEGLALCWGYDGTGDTKADDSSGFLGMLDSIVDAANPTGRLANFYSLAYMDAMLSGHGLAAAISHLVRRLDGAGQGSRQIDIVCHSLGTRTVLKALEVLAERRTLAAPDPAIERVAKVLLLAGACLWYQAGKAMERIVRARPAKLPEMYNIYSSQDEVVRALGSRASLRIARKEAGAEVGFFSGLATFAVGGKTIGIEGKPTGDYTEGQRYPEWVDIDLHRDDVRSWGAMRGLDLEGDQGKGKKDHWVHFTHAPNWELYRRILRSDTGYTLPDLKATLPR